MQRLPMRQLPRFALLRAISTGIVPSDPYDVLEIPKNVNREDLRKRFFALAREHHPSLTGDSKKYQQICQAYETAIKNADEASPVAAWDGISGMTYAQAWQGKDFWRKKWESHWTWRLAHMYKHKEEMDTIAKTVNLREAQYNQVRDWTVLASKVMDYNTRTEWEKYCDLWRGQILWTRTNKTNYRRYYISNQNVPAYMGTVYKEHEFWRKFEEGQWQEWEAFFQRAQAWIAANEGRIRETQNLEVPALVARYEFLLRGRYEMKTMDPEARAQLAQAEYPMWRRAVLWRQLARVGRFVWRYYERILRATFPVFLAVLLYLWWYEVRVRITVLEPQPLIEPGQGPVLVKYRQPGPMEWAREKLEKIQQYYSPEAVKKRLTESITAIPGVTKK